MLSAADRRELLRAARLYLVTERPEIVPAAIEGGVGIVQLRMKSAGDEEVVARARELASVCRERGALFILNDRPDLAVAAGADGVHVGQDDEPVDSARAIVGRDRIVGVSTHSEAQADAGARSSADYIAVGPIWETPTKQGRPAVGLGLVRHAAAHVAKPWFAIGGIDAERLPAVVDAGARRIVVVRAIELAGDPRAAAERLTELLDREPVGGKAQ